MVKRAKPSCAASCGLERCKSMMSHLGARSGTDRDCSTGIFALVRTAEAASAVHSRSTDVSFSIILGLMWAGMERNIAIMVASVPPMRPLAEPLIKLTSRTFSYGRKPASDPQSYQMGGSNKFRRIINDSDRRLPTGNPLYNAKTSKGSQAMNVSQERILPVQTHEHV